MEQKVKVQTVHPNGNATVIHVRESACSGDCHKCSGCGAAKEAIRLEASNPIGAEVGDLVIIESDSGPVLRAAAVLYMLPLVLFFLGYLIGAAAFAQGALGGCLAFVLSIVFVVFYDRKIAKKKPAYRITNVVKK